MSQFFLQLVLSAFKRHNGFIKTIIWQGSILLILLTVRVQGFSQTFNPDFAGRISNGDGPPPYLAGINDVFVQGNFAYAAVGNGLEIIDISLPLLPVHRGSLRQADDPAISQFIKIWVKGNYVYAICTNDNFVVIDISNPSAPKRVGYYAFPNNFFIYLGDLFVSGNYAYITQTVTDGGVLDYGLYVLDISNPLSPKSVGPPASTISGLPFSWKTSFVLNNYCYLSSDGFVSILDFTNPASPIEKSNFSISADVKSIYVENTRAYFVTTNSVMVYDVDLTNPSSPSYLGQINNGDNGAILDNTNAGTVGIRVNGNYAYVTSYAGNAIEVLDITGTTPTHVTSLVNGPNVPLLKPTSIFLSGTYAYVASAGSSALEIIDISNAASPQHSASLTKSPSQIIMGQSFSSAVAGNYVFTTQYIDNAISVTNISNPQSPSFVSNLLNGDHGAYINKPVSIAISGNYAYIANRGVNSNPHIPTSQAYLQILDISDPSNLLPVGKYTSAYPASSVALSGDYAFVLANDGSKFNLIALNVSNPALPSVASTVTTNINNYPFSNAPPYPNCGCGNDQFGSYNSISISGNYAYIVANQNLTVVDISTPATMTASSIKSTVPISYANSGTVINTGGITYVYVVSSAGGYASVTNTLTIYDVSTTPTSPKKLGSYSSTDALSAFTTVAAYNNYALLCEYLTNSIRIFDVSSALSNVSGTSINIPPPISSLSTWGVNSTSANLNLVHPNYITISDHYAYVVSNNDGDGHLEILDLYSSILTGFTPATGNENSTVTLNGQNFDSFLNVSFNGLPATVTSYTPTQATVMVPVGARIGPIKIADHGNSHSSANFLVIPKSSMATNFQQNGFTANWSDVGATAYYLDISTDNFSTYVSGYNNFNVGNITSLAITGLAPGTTYQYRVRSTDGTIVSSNSNSISIQTISATPVFTTVSQISQVGFILNWSASAGALGYYLDVSLDNTFSSIVGGYNNLQIGATSQNVSGLNAGVTYYCRIRSYNANGVSSNSSTVSPVTLPANPVAQNATSATTNGFTINWTLVAGATNYFVDLSTDNFATLVSGYSNLSVGNVSSYVVNGLSPSTTYLYRLRASNTSGNSGNSNIATALTLTPVPAAQPTALTFSNASASSVNVSYTLAAGSPSGYLVLRSPNTQPSTAPVSGTAYAIGSSLGNSIVANAGPLLSFFDGGLPTGVTYYYAVYSFNGNGASILYLTTNPLQGSVTLDVQPPVISQGSSPNPSTITGGNTPIFNAVITDNVSVSTAEIFYRGISRSTFKSTSLTPSGVGGNYSIQVQTDWYDSLGLEYYFSATDGSGNKAVSELSYTTLVTPSISVPSLPSGDSQKNYRIIAFPYQLATDNKVTTVYSGVPWNDNSKAAMWHWNPSAQNGGGAYEQYGSPNAFQTVDPGKGYWVITKTSITPQLANVPAPKYSRSNLFTITLKPNWNEIGNPYPVPISWDDVIALNQKNNVTAFSSLTVYDGTSYKTAKGSVLLKPFEGGFVKNLSSSDITIQIPFLGQTSIGGRMESMGSDISQEQWNVSLYINQEDFTNELGGFGMHPSAKPGPDRYDNFNPPRLMDSPEVNFKNSDFPETFFSNDMVPSQESYHWRFTPEGKSDSHAQLTWTKDLKASAKQLFLLDEQSLSIIDMTDVKSYEFTLNKGSRFSIFYGSNIDHKVVLPEVAASSPYPNPVSVDASINLNLPDSESNYQIALQIFNNKGEPIGSNNIVLPSGIHPLKFGFADQTPAGMYFYKVNVRAENTSVSYTGKIIKL